MVTFREAVVTDDSAHALLAEYFAARAASFPPSQGNYVTALPSPEHFVPPAGQFLIVEGEDLAGEPADVGCGGIRRIDDDPVTGASRFEVKHLWLQPPVRRLGYGRLLLAELERRAIALGARQIVLDTNSSLEAAGGLYRSSGYEEITPYNDNPNANHWYGKSLTA
ncbi:GNAT family N-acetyltransferase [Glaciihabitans sp. dw_435]|uniref:GNAT family N-acetyltransferase n=1 Tax=Glaciihabitans sp. dw_435 TaxID=2720081 RepID=UPI001BD26673|nr:N-acetyltransferase [Glaciihabitans sp. dw_435]